MSPEPLRLFGRSSSHFTRVAAIVARELGVPYELVVVPDLTSLYPEAYGGHPALRIPTLAIGDARLFGAENVCRRLAAIAGRAGDPRVIFTEHLDSDLARSAQELVWHAMAAQVQIVVGVVYSRLPADALVFAKADAGLRGALGWLDAHVDEVLGLLPAPRAVSIVEVTLFCLVEHLAFRPTAPLDPYPRLRAFAASFATRASAKATPFRYDTPPPTVNAMALRLPALDPSTLAPRTGSGYPEPFRSRVLPREKRALGDALGLTTIGVNLTTLPPGKESAMRHWHTHEDEMVYVLEGEVVLRTDEGEQILGPGMCAGFPASAKNGHHLVNRGDRPARYLEISNRHAADGATYSDDDLAARKDAAGKWEFTRKDGSSY